MPSLESKPLLNEEAGEVVATRTPASRTRRIVGLTVMAVGVGVVGTHFGSPAGSVTHPALIPTPIPPFVFPRELFARNGESVHVHVHQNHEPYSGGSGTTAAAMIK